jgi:signal transduction histidine kinase
LEPISHASHQLRALALLSGSLTDPLSPEAAADFVERQAFAVLGATSAVVVTRGEFPPNDDGDISEAEAQSPTQSPVHSSAPASTLTLVRGLGQRDHVDTALQQLLLDAPVPLAEVARTGEPIFLESQNELRRYLLWGDAMADAGVCAFAAVPVWANGHLRGVLGLTWTTTHVFDEDERAFVLTLGVMCAQAIMRGHLTIAKRRAGLAAEHANRAKTLFLRTMSHELRTPLNAVLGYTDLLSDGVVGPVTAVQKKHLGSIRRSSDHLLALIEELLHFAQLEAGEVVVRLERVIAADVIDETIDILRPIAEEKGLRLRFDRPDRSIALVTDRLKLRQMLVNLASNAVKYTDAGEVTLDVRAEENAAARTIRFEIADSGRGISDSDQRHIFEAFWQVDHSLTRKSGSTGLGLSVARQLAHLLGGDVELKWSAVGSGSCFVLSLPGVR